MHDMIARKEDLTYGMKPVDEALSRLHFPSVTTNKLGPAFEASKACIERW